MAWNAMRVWPVVGQGQHLSFPFIGSVSVQFAAVRCGLRSGFAVLELVDCGAPQQTLIDGVRQPCACHKPYAIDIDTAS
ncbi:uncharacterized protein LOC117579922 isoform X2 [Drosophila guanche]|uniref:uncharacterized protein LOC117579922 isoform X2 n=1 Tax=Drosophila guanche TaxID=7266 RepID=UPI0014719F2A|nr:uncharacterized protein LOC117579922 isoform X2 [Drosophila guanche]